MKLSQEQIREFHDTGWLTMPGLFNAGEIERMRARRQEDRMGHGAINAMKIAGLA